MCPTVDLVADLGADLERVAEHEGLSVDDVITLHTKKSCVIRCLGAPRLCVPAGAVSAEAAAEHRGAMQQLETLRTRVNTVFALLGIGADASRPGFPKAANS
jgi:hypothetical protein